MANSTIEAMVSKLGSSGTMTIDHELKRENRPEDGYQPSYTGYLHYLKDGRAMATEIAFGESVPELEKERGLALDILNQKLQQIMYVKREGNLLHYKL